MVLLQAILKYGSSCGNGDLYVLYESFNDEERAVGMRNSNPFQPNQTKTKLSSPWPTVRSIWETSLVPVRLHSDPWLIIHSKPNQNTLYWFKTYQSPASSLIPFNVRGAEFPSVPPTSPHVCTYFFCSLGATAWIKKGHPISIPTLDLLKSAGSTFLTLGAGEASKMATTSREVSDFWQKVRFSPSLPPCGVCYFGTAVFFCSPGLHCGLLLKLILSMMVPLIPDLEPFSHCCRAQVPFPSSLLESNLPLFRSPPLLFDF